MKTDTLALRTAATMLQSYAHEDARMEEHAEGLECRDCEAFLRLGIDAFDWIIRADQIARQAIYDGAADFDHDAVDRALRELCRAWLKSSGRTEAWANAQQSKGRRLGNLERFQACSNEMQAIVKAQESGDAETMPAAIIALRDKAIEEHARGETAEFI